MNRRRALFALVAMAATAGPAQAQGSGVRRIGFLSGTSADAAAARVAAFREAMRELGYIEGRNFAIEFRWAEGRDDRLGALAAGLVASGVELIVTQGGAPTAAAREASGKLPIVAAISGDLVAAGLAQSFARRGGNVTGLTQINPELGGKRLQLLRELLPQASDVAVLFNPGNPIAKSELAETQAAAQALGLKLVPFGVAEAREFGGAFQAMRASGVKALVVLSDIMFFGQRQRLAQAVAEHRLPAIAWTGELAASGVLAGYGADALDMHRRAASCVDRILRGARPCDLPIERPAKFELVLNLSAARELGVAVPQSLLIRADKVIE